MKDLVTVEAPAEPRPRTAAGQAMVDYLAIEQALDQARKVEDATYLAHKEAKARCEELRARLRACADQVGIALNHLPRQSALSAGDRSRS